MIDETPEQTPRQIIEAQLRVVRRGLQQHVEQIEHHTVNKFACEGAIQALTSVLDLMPADPVDNASQSR